MRTRPRGVVRLLATWRHSARCRALRAASTQEALQLAKEEADEAPEREQADTDESAASDTPCAERAHRRMH